MKTAAVDRITGLLLIVVAALWCWAVMVTVPAAEETARLGPRGFPLGLGVLLGVLGVSLMVTARGTQGAAAPRQDGYGRTFGTEVWAVVMTLALIVGYALAMEYFGFVVATVGTVALALAGILGLWRRPVLVLGLSLGLAVGIYVVFGKLLGVYLPHGRLIDLTF